MLRPLSTRQLAKLSRIAFADRTQIFDADGKVKPPAEWSDEMVDIVTSYKVTETTNSITGTVVKTTSVRFRDPAKALRRLGEHLGMIPSTTAD